MSGPATARVLGFIRAMLVVVHLPGWRPAAFTSIVVGRTAMAELPWWSCKPFTLVRTQPIAERARPGCDRGRRDGDTIRSIPRSHWADLN